MHALTILQRCVAPRLTGMHQQRQRVLLAAVAATVSGPRLTLTTTANAAAGDSEADHRCRRRLQGAVLPRGRAPRLALGWARARATSHQTQAALAQPQAGVCAGHPHVDGAWHRRVGAQQSAARRLRAGARATGQPQAARLLKAVPRPAAADAGVSSHSM